MQRDVDPVEAEPFEALLERASDAVGAVVEDDAHRIPDDVVGILAAVERLAVDVGAGRDAGRRPDQAADLGRQHERVAGLPGERRAYPSFRGPVPVQRRRVEGAHPERPGVADRVDGARVVDGAEQAADRGATEAEAADLQAGPAERDALRVVDRHQAPSLPCDRAWIRGREAPALG